MVMAGSLRCSQHGCVGQVTSGSPTVVSSSAQLRVRPFNHVNVAWQVTHRLSLEVRAQATGAALATSKKKSAAAERAERFKKQPQNSDRLKSSGRPQPSYSLAQTDKYAIVEVGGTQIFVEEGRFYTVNRLKAPIGSKIQFGRVLGVKYEEDFHIGRPFLSDFVVEAEVLEECKGPKLIVFKHRPKKHYQRKTGHRQPLTKFLVTKITKGLSAAAAAAPEASTPEPVAA